MFYTDQTRGKVMKNGVTQLGYIGLNVSDMEAWKRLAADIFGMDIRSTEASENLYLKLDERTHRIILQPSDLDGLGFIGWELPDVASFERQCGLLEEAGVKLEFADNEEKRQRRVVNFAKFVDPAGFSIEIYHGSTIDGEPFSAGRPISGFKTGNLGLGHVVVTAEDSDALAEFYTTHLGFKLSEFMEFGGGRIAFLHCNAREHSFAIVDPGLGVPPGQLHHIMVEVNSLDDVGKAYDLCLEGNIPLILSLGRHTNDLMTSFYLKTPSGFAFEYGFGGLEIDEENWQVKHYTAPKLWGHNPL